MNELRISVVPEEPRIDVYRNADTGKLEFCANSTDPVVVEDETEMLVSLIRMVTTTHVPDTPKTQDP